MATSLLFVEECKMVHVIKVSSDFHRLDFFFFLSNQQSTRNQDNIHRKPHKCVTPAFVVTKKYTKYLGFVKQTSLVGFNYIRN